MGLLLGCLPAATIILWIAALHVCQLRRAENSNRGISESIMRAVALAGGWFVLGTELLSAINAIHFWPIFLWWAIPFIFAIVFLIRNRAFIKIDLRGCCPQSFNEWLVAIPLLVIVAIAGFTALAFPPTTYDVLTYHLPRQVMWMQQHNVQHFSTYNLRQIVMPPLAEYMGLHVYVLSHTDRLHNLIQWASLLVMFVPVTLFTKKLGGNRTSQWLACLLIVVMPIIFLQISNSKNDIVVAMWILIAAWWAMDSLDVLPTIGKSALMGLAIGSAALTKGTGQLFILPVVLLFTVAMLRRFSAKTIVGLFLAGVLSLSMSLPHFSRNWKMFHNISGPVYGKGGYDLYNTSFKPNAMLSNVIRNLAYQAGVPGESVNKSTYDFVTWIHDNILKIGVNDPLTTSVVYGTIFRVPYLPADESRAGAPVHIALLLLLPIMLFLARRRMNIKPAMILIALAGGGFVIFCWALKWQEFHNRYFVALVAMIAPVIAVACVVCIPRYLIGILSLGLTASLWPSVMEYNNSSPRPLMKYAKLIAQNDVQKMTLYSEHYDDFLALDYFAKSHPAKIVAITGTGDFPDYVVQRSFLRANQGDVKFHYIGESFIVDGPPDPPPDVFIATSYATRYFDEPSGREYAAAYQSPMLSVLKYLPQVSNDYPVFSQFKAESGFDPIGGPFPNLKLPIVRWGIFPESHLTIHADEAGPKILRLVMRRNNDGDQAVTVELNGKAIDGCKLPMQLFTPMRVRLDLQKGDNEVVLKYAKPDVYPPTARLAVLFQAIQLLPADEIKLPAK